MSRFILDCSMTLAWFFEDESSSRSQAVFLSIDEQKILVPSLWPLEVANVLTCAERRNRTTTVKVAKFVDMLRRLPIVVDAHTAEIALDDILPLARRHRLTAYDAAYLELALRTGHPLASLDDSLNKAATALGVELFNG